MAGKVSLEFTVQRGNDRGVVLVPHKCKDGSYLASMHKDGPHKHVWKEEDLVPLVRQGWSIRMSPRDKTHGRGASLISPSSLLEQ